MVVSEKIQILLSSGLDLQAVIFGSPAVDFVIMTVFLFLFE